MNYAIINNNKVDNIIVAEADFVQIIAAENQYVINVDGQNVSIGQEYINNEFVVPVIVEPEPEVIPPKTIFTKLEFRNKFTFSELVAIEEAAVTDAGIRVFQTNLNVAEFIDVTDANTISGMEYLVTKTLLTELRKTEILSAS